MAYGDIWEIELLDEWSGRTAYFKGSDKYVVDQKAKAQRMSWSAEKTIDQLSRILEHTLKVNDAIAWETFFDKKSYTVNRPKKPTEVVISSPPTLSSTKYLPQFGFWDTFFPKWREGKERISKELFAKDMSDWESIKKHTEVNRKIEESKRTEAVRAWEKDKEKFEYNQKLNNEKITNREKSYLDKNSDLILDYCNMVLTNSEYPECLSSEWKLGYQSDSGIIVVDYSLPSLEDLPKIKVVKYVATRNEIVETSMSDAEFNKLYDNVLYQIALRTIHEMFEADTAKALKSIVFNGWVNFVEKSTGRDSNACILSVQAEKDEFMAINLERVDPKACFVQLKGVGSSKLHGLTPVAPIINTNTQDKRFVSSYEVVNRIDESVNLAAIDWQDFENLIREVFEKEFSSNGGEVKITQASRDGGVDAVAFDPDPIRGGKIVIQAKRYTNVVGVSAVRDLYGTTMNEGATKGILVTTANYGPDAYEFAKGKPLTLLNGSNLLHLLEKHGHKAKIDLKEAKAILNAEKY